VDPELRSLRREILWMRGLLEAMARDLERAATFEKEKDPWRERRLRSRAMQIRGRLHEGLPSGWTPAPQNEGRR
jgi:hypothetical protein